MGRNLEEYRSYEIRVLRRKLLLVFNIGWDLYERDVMIGRYFCILVEVELLCDNNVNLCIVYFIILDFKLGSFWVFLMEEVVVFLNYMYLMKV